MPSPNTGSGAATTWDPFSDNDGSDGSHFALTATSDASMSAGSAGNSMLTSGIDAGKTNPFNIDLPIAAEAAAAASGIGSGAKEHLTTKQKHFVRFFELIGHSHSDVIGKVINKLSANLRAWGDDKTIIDRSLAVFSDMAFTYSSVRLLNTLAATDFVLKNHGPRHFPFLEKPGAGRARTQFYTCLARVLFMQEDPELKYDEFFRPIAETMDQIAPRVSRMEKSPELAYLVAGVARDLRGIIHASHNKRTYQLVFDSLFP